MDSDLADYEGPDWSEGLRRFTRIFWLHALLCFAAIAFSAAPNQTEKYNLAINQLIKLDDHPLAGGRYYGKLFDVYYESRKEFLDAVLSDLMELDPRFGRTGDASILRAGGILSLKRGNIKLDPSGRVSNLLRLSNSEIWGFDQNTAMQIEILEPDYEALVSRLRSINNGQDGQALQEFTFARTPGDLIKCSYSRGSCIVELIKKDTAEAIEFAIDHNKYLITVVPDKLGLPYEIDRVSEFYTDVQNLDRRPAIEKLGALRNQFLGQDKFGASSLVLVGESARKYAPYICTLVLLLYLLCVVSLFSAGASREGAINSFSIPFIVGITGVFLRLIFLILLPHVTQAFLSHEVIGLADTLTLDYLWTTHAGFLHVGFGFLTFVLSQIIVVRN